MSRRRSSVEKPIPEARRARVVAQAAGNTLRSHAVGALPLINGILKRLQLREHLQAVLPAEDGRADSLRARRQASDRSAGRLV